MIICVWYVFIPPTSTPSPSLKNPEFANTVHFNCWTQDVSYFTEKSIFSVCALEASSVYISLECKLHTRLSLASKVAVMSQNCGHSYMSLASDVRWAQRNIPPSVLNVNHLWASYTQIHAEEKQAAYVHNITCICKDGWYCGGNCLAPYNEVNLSNKAF